MLIDAFNNDDHWWERLLNRAAHWMIYVLPVGITAMITSDVSRWAMPHTKSTGWVALIAATQIVGLMFVLTYIAYYLHNSLTRLCIRCMSEMPADAPVRAQKRRRTLRTAHLAITGRGIAVACVLLVFSWIGPGPLADIPVALWIAVTVPAGWVHHRLRPWCPYCPNWGGGGGIREPSPDPVDHNLIKN